VLDEQLWATSYIAHPYQWPVIGWMSDIEHWTMEDLKHHFEMGYSPNNATMVVVGDVSAEEIFKLCETYIEPIPTHPPPPPVTTVEPQQKGRETTRGAQAGGVAVADARISCAAIEQTRTSMYTNILRTILSGHSRGCISELAGPRTKIVRRIFSA